MMPDITFILAMDENNLIGKNNNLPWHLPADLKYFKSQTLNKTVIMGRKTCESLPFVLPKRRNIVLTRNINFSRKGFETIHKLDCLQDFNREIMVIGGATIYKLLMPVAKRILITKIHHAFEGDTYFEWNEHEWQLRSEINYEADNENRFPYSFCEYTRN